MADRVIVVPDGSHEGRYRIDDTRGPDYITTVLDAGDGTDHEIGEAVRFPSELVEVLPGASIRGGSA